MYNEDRDALEETLRGIQDNLEGFKEIGIFNE